MADEPTVEVTIGTLGAGETTVELEPGESMSEAFSDPAYVEVRALEAVSADGSGDPIEAAGTTHEQKQTGDDREWTVDLTQCDGCGERYPADYTRCQTCGTPNK